MANKPFQSRLGKAEQELSKLFDGTHLVGFRDDVESIWVANRDDESWDINPKTVALEVETSLERSRKKILTVEDGVNKLQLFDGLTGGLLGLGTYYLLTVLGVGWIPAVLPSIAVFLIFTLLNHGLIFTKA